MNIIELARQSGGKVWPYAKSVDFSYDELERFAALVRQEERERAAKVCDEHATGKKAMTHYAALTYANSAQDCAAAIRGMSDKARGA